ncbi:peflin isoform X3 [Copidosoma floridanum]|uniref:peflin isoform X2 n=1 Tax=Copidosoma floridanum TaxID=29053 RepID=UPI0006C9D307|nr:peflin isoform X2 [Copidosoma floridanum]XP_014206989.1 peflin isoform X3 [Copidosoma floridanum]
MAFPGHPYGAPGGAPVGYSAGFPGAAPAGFPGGAPVGYSGGFPGAAPAGFPGSCPQIHPQVQSWFANADIDGSGRISAFELHGFLNHIRSGMFSIETARALIAKFGHENKISVNIYESQALFDYINARLLIFNVYDHSQSGCMNGADLGAAFAQMGYTLSSEFFELVISRGYGDDQAMVSIDNFIMLFLQIEKLTDEFNMRQPNSAGHITLDYEDFLTVILKSDF